MQAAVFRKIQLAAVFRKIQLKKLEKFRKISINVESARFLRMLIVFFEGEILVKDFSYRRYELRVFEEAKKKKIEVKVKTF